MQNLQSTMQSWINLENENLSLKEQGIGLLFWPSNYEKNKPLGEVIEPKEYPCTKFAKSDCLSSVCRATEKALISLSFYMRKLPRDNVPFDVAGQMDKMRPTVELLRKECELLRIMQWAARSTATTTLSFSPAEYPEPRVIKMLPHGA